MGVPLSWSKGIWEQAALGSPRAHTSLSQFVIPFCVAACSSDSALQGCFCPPGGWGAVAEYVFGSLKYYNMVLPNPSPPYFLYSSPWVDTPKGLALRVHETHLYWAHLLSKSTSHTQSIPGLEGILRDRFPFSHLSENARHPERGKDLSQSGSFWATQEGLEPFSSSLSRSAFHLLAQGWY